MDNQIHGHEVLEMMVSSETAYSKESLVSAIEEKFGPEARFHTCSEEGMTAMQLVEFLESKGKFVGSEKSFSTRKEKICNH